MLRRRMAGILKWLIVVTACFWVTMAPVSDSPASAGISGFVPFSPPDGAVLTEAPEFAWTPGNYNLFLFFSVFHYQGFGEVPFAFWIGATGFQMPEAWWDVVETDVTCRWVVIGLNTTSLDWEVSSLSEFTKKKVPILIFPEDGAVDQDNACIIDNEQIDFIEWDFDWEPCPGATKYNIVCKKQSAQNPIFDTEVVPDFYHHTNSGIIPEQNRHGWGWKVRAADAQGVWGPWSEEWFFSVEPPQTDCP